MYADLYVKARALGTLKSINFYFYYFLAFSNLITMVVISSFHVLY